MNTWIVDFVEERKAATALGPQYSLTMHAEHQGWPIPEPGDPGRLSGGLDYNIRRSGPLHDPFLPGAGDTWNGYEAARTESRRRSRSCYGSRARSSRLRDTTRSVVAR